MHKIYLDNSATTKMSSEVLNAMLPVFCEDFGNPNSPHLFGRKAQELVDNARSQIAKGINAKSGEIYFTSGGTESNNLALWGLVQANKDRGNKIITSQIEHPSVLESCKRLEEMGFEVVYLPVDSRGFVDLASLLHEVDRSTILVSIMSANNEVGTIQNLKTIAQIAHEKGVLFHTDAVQALGSFRLDTEDLQVDAMSISSHKIHGPKGVGALYVRKGVKFSPLIVGGEQEREKRGGTLNVPAIVGFGKAVELTTENYAVNCKKMKKLREYFVSLVASNIEGVTFNGPEHQRLAGLASVTFENVEGEALVTLLDMKGIAVSTGSACSTGSVEASHVLRAMGMDTQTAKGTLRFSFSTQNTKKEVEDTVLELKNCVEQLRKLSPKKPKKRAK